MLLRNTEYPLYGSIPIVKCSRLSPDMKICLFNTFIINNGESVKKRKDPGQSPRQSLHLGWEERPLPEPQKVQTAWKEKMRPGAVRIRGGGVGHIPQAYPWGREPEGEREARHSVKGARNCVVVQWLGLWVLSLQRARFNSWWGNWDPPKLHAVAGKKKAAG